MFNKKILVVDDDKRIVDLVKLYLEDEGHRVIPAYDGDQALSLARQERPDLIVLDLMLPGRDGLEVCQILRTESEVPIIMLTARTTERDKLAGLDLGADDYVIKPFSPRELVARIRAVLRRMPEERAHRGPPEVAFGDLKVRFLHHDVAVGGQPVNLTPAEFDLLATLVREPGRAFTRVELIEAAFGHEFEGSERAIDVHILNLRKKIEPDPRNPRYIKSVYGVGYKFAGE